MTHDGLFGLSCGRRAGRFLRRAKPFQARPDRRGPSGWDGWAWRGPARIAGDYRRWRVRRLSFGAAPIGAACARAVRRGAERGQKDGNGQDARQPAPCKVKTFAGQPSGGLIQGA